MAVSNRASTRLSIYSMTPTLAPSIAPSHLSTASETPSEKACPLAHDMKDLHSGFARLEQPKLQNQRFAMTETKKEDLGKLALGAKLDRALGRRMVSQDASFTRGMGQKEKPRHVDIMDYSRFAGEEKGVAV
jgi:hypothetical protein